MQHALVRFASALVGSSVGLMFFAGHAFQIDGLNFLAGIDTNVSSEYAVSITALNLASVLGAMRSAAVRTGLVILDACRDNPFEGISTRSAASSELAPVFAPKGTLIAFSTSPGQRAGDGRGLRNGYYTQALLQHIDTSNILIETMFKRVRSSLEAITGGRQTSWEHTSLTGDFRFQRRHAPGKQRLWADCTLGQPFSFAGKRRWKADRGSRISQLGYSESRNSSFHSYRSQWLYSR